MEGRIDADTPLDHASVQIFPTQNRYEVFVCGDDKVEKLIVGPLEQLLPHLPRVNDMYAKGSNDTVKLQVTGECDNVTWFTKSTLDRFLHIVGSPDSLSRSKVIEGEMSQLEKARKFHFSLYAKGHQDLFKSGETDGCNSTPASSTVKPEFQIDLPDSSKNELLRAMDLRLTALREELVATLNEAAGHPCSSKEVTDLLEFCEYFGAAALKKCLRKMLESSQEHERVVLPNDDEQSVSYVSRTDSVNKTDGHTQISRSVFSVTPVKCGVSPAMVAQAERQSSIESDESPDSSDQNQRFSERSRAHVRSVPARRSASPMRRIQIGRNGSRRAAALTVKSLNHYPARERTSSHRDVAASSSEEEGPEQPSKKLENDIQRMSVQDAISLFESKQKDQNSDVLQRSSISCLSTKKAVLRRWSAGTAGCSNACQSELVSEASVPLAHNNVVDKDVAESVEEKSGSNLTSACPNPDETTTAVIEFDQLNNAAHDPMEMQTDANAVNGQESNINTTSADWNRQKELELNQMLMKKKDRQPVKRGNSISSRSQNVTSEQRSGFYDDYKEKRDEKLRGGSAVKRAEKEAKIKAMQQILYERKAEMASVNVKDVGKKNPSLKPQKANKTPTQTAKPRSEIPKASVAKKVLSKTPTLPATPSTRAAAASPSKTPAAISSASTTQTHRKPQSTPSVTRSGAKVEKSRPRHTKVKDIQTDRDKSLKDVKEKVQEKAIKNGKVTKSKDPAVSGDHSNIVPSKPTYYNKGIKKSSVMPVESKPFLRKRLGPCVALTVKKTKNASQLDESSIKGGNMIESEENEVVVNTSVAVSEHNDQDLVSPVCFDAPVEPETLVKSHQNCGDTEKFNRPAADSEDSLKVMAESSAKTECPAETISPTLWVEIEEQQDLSNYDAGTTKLASRVHTASVGLSSPRIRHSLSQMLQEDSSEPDTAEPDTAEWGNAENPPAMVFQKDAPKGLKRLLKFARKSKGDTNSTGWSSPSVFSEGEDEIEESKFVVKRNSDNLLRKASLHSKNYRQQKTSISGYAMDIDAHELHSGISKLDTQGFHKLHEGQVSTAASTTKGTRSFFSLSAFRGTKPNETKLH